MSVFGEAQAIATESTVHMTRAILLESNILTNSFKHGKHVRRPQSTSFLRESAKYI